MSSQWYIQRNGEKSGPFTSEQLKRFATTNELAPADQIWKEGMAAWASASRLNGLFAPPAKDPAATTEPAPSASPMPSAPRMPSISLPPSTPPTTVAPAIAPPAIDSLIEEPQPAASNSFLERAKAGAADLAATAKAAARLTAVQAERTKLLQATLPALYIDFGKQVHVTGEFRLEFATAHEKIDKALAEIHDLQADSSSAIPAEGLAEKAKAAAQSAKAAAQVKAKQFLLRNEYRDLGTAVFEQHGRRPEHAAATQPIQDALDRVAVLDAETTSLSASHSGHLITPKRFAIGAAVLLVLGLVVVGQFQSSSSSTADGKSAAAASSSVPSPPRKASDAYKEGYGRTVGMGRDFGFTVNENAARINSADGWPQQARDREIASLLELPIRTHRDYKNTIPTHLPKDHDAVQTLQGVADGFRDGFNSSCTVYQLR